MLKRAGQNSRHLLCRDNADGGRKQKAGACEKASTLAVQDSTLDPLIAIRGRPTSESLELQRKLLIIDTTNKYLNSISYSIDVRSLPAMLHMMCNDNRQVLLTSIRYEWHLAGRSSASTTLVMKNVLLLLYALAPLLVVPKATSAFICSPSQSNIDLARKTCCLRTPTWRRSCGEARRARREHLRSSVGIHSGAQQQNMQGEKSLPDRQFISILSVSFLPGVLFFLPRRT